jgi:hypothetical protein
MPQEGGIIRQDFVAKRLDMELDGRFDIRESFFVTFAFAHHDPLQAEGISHITIGVLFHDDLDLSGHFLV